MPALLRRPSIGRCSSLSRSSLPGQALRSGATWQLSGSTDRQDQPIRSVHAFRGTPLRPGEDGVVDDGRVGPGGGDAAERQLAQVETVGQYAQDVARGPVSAGAGPVQSRSSSRVTCRQPERGVLPWLRVNWGDPARAGSSPVQARCLGGPRQVYRRAAVLPLAIVDHFSEWPTEACQARPAGFRVVPDGDGFVHGGKHDQQGGRAGVDVPERHEPAGLVPVSPALMGGRTGPGRCAWTTRATTWRPSAAPSHAVRSDRPSLRSRFATSRHPP